MKGSMEGGRVWSSGYRERWTGSGRMDGETDRRTDRRIGGEMQKCRWEGGAGTKAANPSRASWASSVVLGLLPVHPFQYRNLRSLSSTASVSLLRHRGGVRVID